jgi:hypothetical protein
MATNPLGCLQDGERAQQTHAVIRTMGSTDAGGGFIERTPIWISIHIKYCCQNFIRANLCTTSNKASNNAFLG